MDFGSKFGNERKDRLESYLDAELQKRMAHMLSEMRFIVLNASLWRCKEPWAVPERRISDNLALFIAEGELDLTIDGKAGVARSGDCVFIPEHTMHSYRFHEGCSQGALFIIHALPLLPTAENPFAGFDSPIQTLRHPEAVLAALHRGIALRNYNDTTAFTYVGEILRGVFLDALETRHYQPDGASKQSARLKNAFVFINDNFANDISVGEMARSVNLKEVQFRRVFKMESGLSPNAYLHRLRLLNAVRILMRYEYGLEQVATLSGFHSASYFCSSFLRFFKRTPGDFRAEFKAST
jgi:AraC-like DNA-binding protein